MFKLFSILLEKMGNWFGIVFKIVLPAVFMYRPIKMVSLSLVVFGSAFGADINILNKFSLIAFVVIYVAFLIMLLLFPKTASATEFVLIFYYFGCLYAFIFVDFFNERVISGINEVALNYARMAPFVLLFLIGKILFFIFLKVNQKTFVLHQREKFGFFDDTM